MSVCLQLILIMLLQIDALLMSLPSRTYNLDKPTAVTWVEMISAVADDISVATRIHSISISFENMPKNVLGGTMNDLSIPGHSHKGKEGISSGRPSLGCLRIIAISTALLNKNNVWNGTTMFISTIGHEVLHTYQGMLCTGNDMKVESTAELGTFAMLGELAVVNQDAEIALVYILRHRFIQAALDLSYQEGLGPDFLNLLHLTDKEMEYYLSLSPRFLKEKSYYWTLPVMKMLSDDDGILTNMATVTNRIDARAFYEYLEGKGIFLLNHRVQTRTQRRR